MKKFKILKRLYKRLKHIGAPPFTIIESQLDGNNSFGANTSIVRSHVGKYSYFGSGCSFYDSWIGHFCCIGNNVRVIAAQHPTSYVSVHPFFYQKSFGNVQENSFPDFKFLNNNELPPISTTKCEGTVGTVKLRVLIEHDVWIGDNVLISGGVRIGTGAIVGMGAVVTKDIPPYAIVGGIPAKVIRYRFEQDIIDALLNSKWWTYPETILGKFACLANNPKVFIEQIKRTCQCH